MAERKSPPRRARGGLQFSLATKREQFRLKAKEIQPKKLAISNVEKDSFKPMKIADREQASRDRKRIRNNAKNDDLSDMWRDRRRGFDACPTLKGPGSEPSGL
ncbi:MAG TPA: hypothetical protein VIS96_18865 [Terrimicrobiaceae bacterium]